MWMALGVEFRQMLPGGRVMMMWSWHERKGQLEKVKGWEGQTKGFSDETKGFPDETKTFPDETKTKRDKEKGRPG